MSEESPAETGTDVQQFNDLYSSVCDLYADVAATVDQVEITINEETTELQTAADIKDEHAQRVQKRYSFPVSYLALQLLEANRWKYLYRNRNTRIAAIIREQGLTTNQQQYLDQLNELLEGDDGE